MPCGKCVPQPLKSLHRKAHSVTICSHQKWIEEQSSSTSSKAQSQSCRPKSSNLKGDIQFLWPGNTSMSELVSLNKVYYCQWDLLLMFNTLRCCISGTPGLHKSEQRGTENRFLTSAGELRIQRTKPLTLLKTLLTDAAVNCRCEGSSTA